MKVLARFEGVKAAEVQSSDLHDKLADLEDTCFNIMLEKADGSKLWLMVSGGNGGSYGADLMISENQPRFRMDD